MSDFTKEELEQFILDDIKQYIYDNNISYKVNDVILPASGDPF